MAEDLLNGASPMSAFSVPDKRSVQGKDLPSPSADSRDRARTHRILLGVILSVSVVLRVIIAVRGGQFFWTDEGSRFGVSREALKDFLEGRTRSGLDAIFSGADHLLFKIIGVIPAFIERAFGSPSWVAAIFFGGFSVLIIYFIWRLVLQLGGSSKEALYSSLLMAACNAYFYYARHVFPYDLALCFYLYAAIRGLRAGNIHSFTAGVLAGLGFLSYYGYWLFGGTILTLLLFVHRGSLSNLVTRAAFNLIGLAIPIALAIAVSRILGHDLVKSSIEFSIGNKLGDFGRTWSFVFDYFWASEKFLLFYWAVAVLAAAAALFTGRLEIRVTLWLAGALMFYLGLVVPSDFLKTFTVFARQVRPLAIFFCLIGGWFLAKLAQHNANTRTVSGLMLVAILMGAAFNMRVPIRQEFPKEFEHRAESIVQRELASDGGLYRVLTDQFITDTAPPGSEPPAIVLERSLHPLQFRPYLLDGYSREKRAEFLSREMTMRVVRLLPERPGALPQISKTRGVWAPGLWTPYPGAMRIEFMFDPVHRTSPQPIVSGGATGAGDELSVEFINVHTLRFAVDHWGIGATYSDQIEYDFEKPHVLIVSFGTLYPSETDSQFQRNPEWIPLKHTMLVSFDGVPVISSKGDCYPARPESITLFHNLLGFGTAVSEFPGRVLSVSAVTPEEILKRN